MANGVALLVSPIVMTFGAIWRGYVLTILWAWFAVPTFGLPALALAPAIGLSLVVGYLTHQPLPPSDEPFNKVLGRYVFLASSVPAIALLIGWIVNHWMPK